MYDSQCAPWKILPFFEWEFLAGDHRLMKFPNFYHNCTSWVTASGRHGYLLCSVSFVCVHFCLHGENFAHSEQGQHVD